MLLAARDLALVASGGVAMHEAFTGGTVGQLHGGNLVGLRRARRLGFLECGPERSALGAIAYRGGPCFPHILFRGCDFGHEFLRNLPVFSRLCARG